MKESCIINGKEFRFKGYRIPEGYQLPAEYKDGIHILEPEAMFESMDGELFGIHPGNKILQEEE